VGSFLALAEVFNDSVEAVTVPTDVLVSNAPHLSDDLIPIHSLPPPRPSA
jgi:hypothetical protein